MKIKKALIASIIFLLCGTGVTVYAASREDFKLSKVFEESNITPEYKEFETSYNTITYDGSLDNILVKYSDEVDSIQINYSESDVRSYTFTTEEDSINIKQKFKDKWIYKANNLKGDITTSFEVILPTNATNLNINLDAGVIKSSDTIFNNLDIDLSAGYIDFKNVESNTANIDLDAGDVTYSGIINDKINVEVAAGAIFLTMNQDESLFKVNNKGAGSISINTKVSVGKSSIKFN